MSAPFLRSPTLNALQAVCLIGPKSGTVMVFCSHFFIEWAISYLTYTNHSLVLMVVCIDNEDRLLLVIIINLNSVKSTGAGVTLLEVLLYKRLPLCIVNVELSSFLFCNKLSTGKIYQELESVSLSWVKWELNYGSVENLSCLLINTCLPCKNS